MPEQGFQGFPVPVSDGLVNLGSVTLGVATPTIAFSGIAPTYSAIQVLGQVRGTAAATFCQMRVQLNGDTAANYNWEIVEGQGTTAAALTGIGVANAALGYPPASTSPAGACATIDMLFPNYAGTVFRKQGRSIMALTQTDANGNEQIQIASLTWRTTAAITSILFLLDSGSFDVGTKLTLYGWP